jgi:hypothetical protein
MAKVFTTIIDLGIVVGVDDFFDLRPPIGEDWEVTELASSVSSGATIDQVPELEAGLLTDAALAAGGVPALIRFSGIDLAGAECNTRGWFGKTSIFINNTCYLRLVNVEAGAIQVAATIRLAKSYGPTGRSSVVSDVRVLAGAIATPIIPPAGQDQVLTDVGSSVWTGGGGNVLNYPNITIDITEAGNLATVANGLNARGWQKPFELHMNNTSYVTLTPAGAATIGWSAFITKEYGPNGASSVITRTRIVPVGTNVIIQPPPGEEWEITDIGCDAAFSGIGAPDDTPTVLVTLQDLAGRVAIAQIAGASKGWTGEMRYFLNETNWMVLTAVNLDIVGVSGIRHRA